MVYDFDVPYDGKTYKCRRIVSGSRLKKQHISVSGLRTLNDVKDDSAIYGTNHHNEESMESAAYMIAKQIIESALSKN